MDLNTEQILKIFNSHIRIKNFVTFACYMIIAGGLLTYVFFSFSYSNNIKIVSDYQDKAKNYTMEKIITNPRINFQHEDGQIYHIEAKKASHQTNEEAVLYDVFAKGELGTITAGELKIDESGDHLIFSNNPVLILNKTDSKGL